MKRDFLISLFFLAALMSFSVPALHCNQGTSKKLRYFEVGVRNKPADWRDSTFVVATSDPAIIAAAEAQLKLPVDKRNMLTGALESGNAGYNKNASHQFKWHYHENGWGFAEISMELCDGRPYSDVDLNLDYWFNSVKRFCPWNSFIKKEL